MFVLDGVFEYSRQEGHYAKSIQFISENGERYEWTVRILHIALWEHGLCEDPERGDWK